MSRFIILVLDGFGIGAMEDVPQVRPADEGANTYQHILREVPNLSLPYLRQLGLDAACGLAPAISATNTPTMVYGRAALTHFGADTFFGHQEIMGTRPSKAFGEPLRNRIDEIATALQQHGFPVRRYNGQKEQLLVVREAVTVGDNVECDRGQAFNVTCALDDIDFEEAKQIAHIVRHIAKVPRVIVFGGRGVHLPDLLGAIEESGDGYIGVNAPQSGVYRSDYHCLHLGYGVDPSVQLPTILGNAGIPVFLLGKAADVIQNPLGESLSIVETAEVLRKTKEIVQQHTDLFLCANVQETDLSGHQENPSLYARILETADRGIGALLSVLSPDDVLVVTADHGNDPTIGHPHHTREYVPLLIRCPISFRTHAPICIGTRATLSDTAATAAEFFNAPCPENGQSYLTLLRI